MAGFVVGDPRPPSPAAASGIVVALVAAALAGLVNGIGVGVFRVHPLIMTLGMGLVVLGLERLAARSGPDGAGVPAALRSLGVGHARRRPAIQPAGVRPGGGSSSCRPPADRLRPDAVRDRRQPDRRAPVGRPVWQVLIVLYIVSAMLAAIAGFLISGFTNVASVSLADAYVLPSVAAAVIGGTSIMGGRGGYGGTIVGALILTVLTALLASLGLPEAVRQVVFGHHRRRGGGLHPGDGRDLTRRGDAHGLEYRAATSGSTSAARTSSGPSSSATATVALSLDRDQVADADRRRGPRRRRRAVGRGRRARRSCVWPGVSSVGIGVPGLFTRRRARPLPRQHSRARGPGPVAGPVGGALAFRSLLINDARRSASPSCGSAPDGSRRRWSA